MAVWFITGCSTGFGKEVARAALARGDQVVATARNVSRLEDLKALGALTLPLDITSPEAEIEKIVAEAIKKYGQIDILLNNAGFLLEGAVEESSDAEARNLFDINVFGSLAVTRAVLPYMRERKSGVIAFVGSIGGWASSVGAGLYCATKFALVGISEALRDEVAHLGIEVTCIEPGYFRTDLLGGSNKVTAQRIIDDLRPVMDPLRKDFAKYNGNQPGDPVKGSQLIVEALTKSGRCENRTLPVRIALGRDAVNFIGGVLESSKKDLEDWRELSVSTDFSA